MEPKRGFVRGTRIYDVLRMAETTWSSTQYASGRLVVAAKVYANRQARFYVRVVAGVGRGVPFPAD